MAKYIPDSDFLMHYGKGEEKKDHKYTAREFVNGAWKYIYDTGNKINKSVYDNTVGKISGANDTLTKIGNTAKDTYNRVTGNHDVLSSRGTNAGLRNGGRAAGTYKNISGSKAGVPSNVKVERGSWAGRTNIGGANGSRAGMPNLSREKAYGKSKTRGKLYDFWEGIKGAIRRAGLRSKTVFDKMVKGGKNKISNVMNRLRGKKK